MVTSGPRVVYGVEMEFASREAAVVAQRELKRRHTRDLFGDAEEGRGTIILYGMQGKTKQLALLQPAIQEQGARFVRHSYFIRLIFCIMALLRVRHYAV